ncbi:hypothetical protein OKW45_001930 [Paraburkholderia sp. WSM4175]
MPSRVQPPGRHTALRGYERLPRESSTEGSPSDSTTGMTRAAREKQRVSALPFGNGLTPLVVAYAVGNPAVVIGQSPEIASHMDSMNPCVRKRPRLPGSRRLRGVGSNAQWVGYGQRIGRLSATSRRSRSPSKLNNQGPLSPFLNCRSPASELPVALPQPGHEGSSVSIINPTFRCPLPTAKRPGERVSRADTV